MHVVCETIGGMSLAHFGRFDLVAKAASGPGQCRRCGGASLWAEVGRSQGLRPGRRPRNLTARASGSEGEAAPQVELFYCYHSTSKAVAAVERGLRNDWTLMVCWEISFLQLFL